MRMLLALPLLLCCIAPAVPDDKSAPPPQSRCLNAVLKR